MSLLNSFSFETTFSERKHCKTILGRTILKRTKNLNIVGSEKKLSVFISLSVLFLCWGSVCEQYYIRPCIFDKIACQLTKLSFHWQEHYFSVSYFGHNAVITQGQWELDGLRIWGYAFLWFAIISELGIPILSIT